MKLERFKNTRLLRRDWIGDGVLTVIAGAALVAGVFLPWANTDRPGDVNFSVSRAAGINGVLSTQWGVPALVVGLLAVALGVVIVVTRPRRYSALLGAAVSICGLVAFGLATSAAAHTWLFSPGLGMYVTTLCGILLVPIGIATAMVGWFVARAESPAATAPPAPGSAPPS